MLNRAHLRKLNQRIADVSRRDIARRLSLLQQALVLDEKGLHRHFAGPAEVLPLSDCSLVLDLREQLVLLVQVGDYLFHGRRAKAIGEESRDLRLQLFPKRRNQRRANSRLKVLKF